MFWLGIPGFNVILVIRHPGFLGARTTRKLSKTNINNYFKYPQRPYLKGDTLIQTNKISISMCQMILGVVHPLDHWIIGSASLPGIRCQDSSDSKDSETELSWATSMGPEGEKKPQQPQITLGKGEGGSHFFLGGGRGSKNSNLFQETYGILHYDDYESKNLYLV